MKKNLMLPLVLAIFLLGINVSCRKGEAATTTMSGTTIPKGSHEWGANDDRYAAALRQYAPQLNHRIQVLCTNGTEDSTFGWYEDEDELDDIPPGPYVTKKANVDTSYAWTCPGLFTLADSAKAYLEAEGFASLIPYYATKPHYMVLAGNALLEIKAQLIPVQYRQGRFVSCLLSAIGVVEAMELINNWHNMTKLKIIKAVFKLAKKHLGIIGAFTAIIQFVECMWE